MSLICEQRRLRDHDIHVRIDAGFVAAYLEFQSCIGGLNGFPKFNDFLGQNPRGREGILHLLKSGQYRLAVSSDVCVIRSDELVDRCTPQPRIEDCF